MEHILPIPRITTAKRGFSLAETAHELGLSVGFLRKEIKRRRLKVSKFSPQVVRVFREDIEKYCEEAAVQ